MGTRVNMIKMVSAQSQHKRSRLHLSLRSSELMFDSFAWSKRHLSVNGPYYIITTQPLDVLLSPHAISRPHHQWGSAAHPCWYSCPEPATTTAGQTEALSCSVGQKFRETDIYLSAVLSYESMRGIIGYCFYMTKVWGILQNMMSTWLEDVLTQVKSGRVE